MPDVFDPYEERGVPNPHEWIDDEVPVPMRDGHGGSNLPPPNMTQTDIDRERARLKKREKKRIRPGFYEGSEPLGDGLDD